VAGASKYYSAEIRGLKARLVLPLSVVFAVVVGGTAGYFWLWRAVGGTWLDALFMTVTTITTVGYGEVKPLDSAGRIFTMIIAIVGVGSLFFTFGVVMEYIVALRLADPTGRRKMDKRIEALHGHIILAGLGRVGRQAGHELAEARMPFLVVEPSEATARHAEELGWLCLQGDATDDAVLERAGVRRARGLIATTANDATNMYIVLSARVLNPKLHIVSRAVDETSVPKLTRAGADRAIKPLCHRRAPPRSPHPEPHRGGLLRDGAPPGQRGAEHRGYRGERRQPGRGPHPGGVGRAPGHGGHRARHHA